MTPTPAVDPTPAERPDGGLFVDPEGDTALREAAVGRWLSCRDVLELREDGSFTIFRGRQACEGTGNWAIESGLFGLELTGGDCDGDAAFSPRIVFVRERGLVLVDPREGEEPRVWVSERVPQRRWLIQGNYGPDDPQRMRRHRAIVIGEPGDGLYSACYWTPPDSEDAQLLSSSGEISQWSLDGREFRGSTSCTGGCRCAAVLRGSVNADGSIEGEFFAANCDDAWDGVFEAFPE